MSSDARVVEPTEIVKTATVAIGVPLAVFTANWVHRSRQSYAQTAAADFILAIGVFDLAVMIASQDFEPFLRSQSLRPLVVYWHFIAGFASALVWLGIVKWGEPVLARYYEGRRAYYRTEDFPFAVFFICWFAVFFLIMAHVTFFALKVGGNHV
jgi:hypothetical protein